MVELIIISFLLKIAFIDDVIRYCLTFIYNFSIKAIDAFV